MSEGAETDSYVLSMPLKAWRCSCREHRTCLITLLGWLPVLDTALAMVMLLASVRIMSGAGDISLFFVNWAISVQ